MGPNGPEEGATAASGQRRARSSLWTPDGARVGYAGACGLVGSCGARSGSPEAPFIGPRIAQRPALLVSDPSMDRRLSAVLQCSAALCLAYGILRTQRRTAISVVPGLLRASVSRFPTVPLLQLSLSPLATQLVLWLAHQPQSQSWQHLARSPAPSLRDACHILTDLMLSHRALPPSLPSASGLHNWPPRGAAGLFLTASPGLFLTASPGLSWPLPCWPRRAGPGLGWRGLPRTP